MVIIMSRFIFNCIKMSSLVVGSRFDSCNDILWTWTSTCVDRIIIIILEMYVSDLALFFQIRYITSLKKSKFMKPISNSSPEPALSYLCYIKVCNSLKSANSISLKCKTLYGRMHSNWISPTQLMSYFVHNYPN